MTENPHCQAAFINAIREEGTHKEACDWLQKTWNDLCAARKELRDRREMPVPEMTGTLRENVARALFLRKHPEGRFSYAEHVECGPDCEIYRIIEDAAAVLAIARPAILEEAAKVAEDYDGDGLSPGEGYFSQLGDAYITQREIVEAIRALKTPA